jgi:branched-chain amino acid transport system substrate-binding protein
MNRVRTLRGVTLLSGFALAALACGGGGGTSGGGSSSNCSKGTITIGSDLPTTGNESSGGIPTQEGAQYAVQSKGCVNGFKLTFEPFDDAVNGKHDPTKGTQNVQQMISDPNVLGMVGPYNSNVAAAEIPVANQAPLAMVSPSNTNECLTQALSYCQKENGFTPQSLRPTGKNNYFRVAAADTFQGPTMADYSYQTLNAKKAAVWDDEETFGKGVADNFAKQFIKDGGQVVSRKSYDPNTKSDFKDFLADAKNQGAQVIYVGATDATKGCIGRSQMAGIFTTDIPYTGPDGLATTQCIKDAGAGANSNMYATVGVADATVNPDAASIVSGYKKAFPKDSDIGAYTWAAYDCAAVLIDAIGRAITANGGKKPSRQQVIDALAQTKNFKGATGTITFTAQGDPTNPALQIQQVKGNPPNWVTIKNVAAPAAS